jgi:hypothetical protein
VNNKVYTHEFIDIRGAKRPHYMHHMTANWSPIAQEERHQLCFGVWGVVGTTDRWPRVVNMWEEDGFTGLAAGLGHETGRPQMQDAKLEKWWNEAASYRNGGYDRVMIPAPWTRTITELTQAGVRGAVYAHETVGVEAGTAADFLEVVRTDMVPAYGAAGLELVSAMRTSMSDASECILIWAIPTWDAWARFELAINRVEGAPGDELACLLQDWQHQLQSRSRSFRRFLMLDAPLCPLRIGRQPARSDRVGNWDEG